MRATLLLETEFVTRTIRAGVLAEENLVLELRTAAGQEPAVTAPAAELEPVAA